jgi:arabinofuranosyltransferase
MDWLKTRRPVQRLGLTACLVFGAIHVLYYWPEVIDDSYIVFRYARNFVQGGWLSFNPGGPNVEGFSSLTWFWLSALLLKLGVQDVLTPVKAVGAILHIATIAGVWVLAGMGGQRSRPAALIAPFLVAISPFMAYHAVTGLETPLYTALIVAAALAILGLETRPRVAGPGLVLSLGLLCMTRPEALGYAGGLLVSGAWVHRDNVRARSLLVRVAVVVVAVNAALFAWRWTAFGQLLPNTVIAKSAGASGQESIGTGIRYVARFFHSGVIPADLPLYLAAGFVLLRHGSRRDVLLATPVLCAMVFSTVVFGDWMHSYRFMTPAVPFLAVLVARAALTASAHPPRRGRVAWAVAATALIGVFALEQVMLDRTHLGQEGFGRTSKSVSWAARIPARIHDGFPARLATITRWSLEHLSPQDVLATSDIGFPGWTLGEPIVDLVGLTDRELARIVPARRAEAFGAYLRSRDPRVIVLRTTGGRPVSACDQLLVESGILSSYVLVDSVQIWDANVQGRIYGRQGDDRAVSSETVLANYDRAIAANPRVFELGVWRRDFEQRAAQGAR